MNKKTAMIFCYIGGIFWLIQFFAYKDRADIGGKNLTNGLLITILECIFLVNIFGIVCAIIGIVKVCKGEEVPELPLLSKLDWNWFKNY